jgi:hypothetical protein
MQQSDDLKLSIELVPSTSWYSNLRGKMEQQDWDKVRENIYKVFDYKCGICGNKGRLHCHEIWEYEERTQKSNLKDQN